jgi:hypothetical protein
MALAWRRFAVLTVWLAATGSLGASATRQEPPASGERSGQPPAKVSLQALEREPERYRDCTVRVSGKLENAGRNYFTDLRLVLKDAAGHTVPVRPWLPLSLPPRPPGASGPPPAVLSDFLGKEVELVAKVRKGALRHFGEVWHLEVTSARLK